MWGEFNNVKHPVGGEFGDIMRYMFEKRVGMDLGVTRTGSGGGSAPAEEVEEYIPAKTVLEPIESRANEPAAEADDSEEFVRPGATDAASSPSPPSSGTSTTGSSATSSGSRPQSAVARGRAASASSGKKSDGKKTDSKPATAAKVEHPGLGGGTLITEEEVARKAPKSDSEYKRNAIALSRLEARKSAEPTPAAADESTMMTVGEAQLRRTFHEEAADGWELKVDKQASIAASQAAGEQRLIYTVKGSGMEEKLEYDQIQGQYALKEGQELSDLDVVGYVKGQGWWRGLNEQQQVLFWKEIEKAGDGMGGNERALAMLNTVESLRRGGEGRRRGEGMLDTGKSHFDPSNPERMSDLLAHNLSENGASATEIEEVLTEFGKKGVDQESLSQMNDIREIRRALRMDVKAQSTDELATELDEKMLVAGSDGRKAMDRGRETLDKSGRDLDALVQTKEVQEQIQVADTLNEDRQRDAALEEGKIEGLLQRAQDERYQGVSVDFSPDTETYSDNIEGVFQRIDSTYEGDEDKKSKFSEYKEAMRDSDFEKAEELFTELKGTSGADSAGLVELEALHGYFRDDMATMGEEGSRIREEKRALMDEMRGLGFDDAAVENFGDRGMSDEEAGDLRTAAKEKKAELDQKISDGEKRYQELEDQTGYEKALLKHLEKEEAWEDLVHALSGGQLARADRAHNRLTDERGQHYRNTDYTDEGLETVKKRRKDNWDANNQPAKDVLDRVQELVGEPGKLATSIGNVIQGISTGVSSINTIAEALNLKLSSTEATDLRTAVTYATLFGESGAGKRGFGRNIFGPEGNFAKYESKRPEDSAAKNLAGLATAEKSGRARRQEIENKDALNTKSNAEAVKLASEGLATEEKESASAGKKRRYKVHTNYGGPGIPV